MSFVRFDSNGNTQTLFAELAGKALPSLQLDFSDQTIDISIFVEYILGTHALSSKQTYSIQQGNKCSSVLSLRQAIALRYLSIL